jgi:hypothetical protein
VHDIRTVDKQMPLEGLSHTGMVLAAATVDVNAGARPCTSEAGAGAANPGRAASPRTDFSFSIRPGLPSSAE